MNPATTAIQAAARLVAHAATLISYANLADATLQRRRRRRKLAAAVAAALCVSGCAAHKPAEPSPPQIERLTCGGKSCTITTSGSATVIWVSE